MSTWTNKQARRDAFDAVPETCPFVDAAIFAAKSKIEALIKRFGADPSDGLTQLEIAHLLADLDNSVKERTTALREALIDAHEAKIEIEQQRDEIDREREKLADLISELETELEGLDNVIEQRDNDMTALEEQITDLKNELAEVMP